MGGAALQVISSYSLLQSSIRIEEVVLNAKQRGYTALALADINVLYGALSFYDACMANGIKPLIGMTLETSTQNKETLVVIAKNEVGYRNLMQISTKKQLLLAKNILDFSIEENINLFEDLIIIIPPNNSFFANKILDGKVDIAKKYLSFLYNIIGEDLYVGVNTTLDETFYETILQYANFVGVETIAFDTIKYLEKNGKFICEVLEAIKRGETLDYKKLQYANKSKGINWLKPVSSLEASYVEVNRAKAFQNMLSLIEQFDFKLESKRITLPKYKTPNGYDANTYLKKLCDEGLLKKFSKQSENDKANYLDRMNKELLTIEKMRFADYFLIVWDVTNYARENQILVGPGRGSAAGSLISYLLGITEVDPLKYNLFFERFLNEKRAQMPDIDLDIPDNRRQEIIEYVNRRYTEGHMAQIITFGTFGAKQALRDVARVMGISQVESDNWSRLIPSGPGINLRKAQQSSAKLQTHINKNEQNQLLFRTAMLLEGLPRHYSVHAAGIVLSDTDLKQVVPLQMGNENILLTQYTKNDVERVGLLKIDFLGLRNLTILNNTLLFIKRNFNKSVDINQIPLDDRKTLNLFQQAETSGVFQFESGGIRNVLRKLHPTSFEDIAAVNALFRPGPMENIDSFIARKHGREKITYPNDSLIPILKNTYGILVYQEQVMQVASVMGGFSLGQADMLRRAMSKKNAAVIKGLKSKFVKGALALGYSNETAKKVYDYIAQFANYGFNRSHAVAYSKMAFQLAFLKVHYPASFFGALLNAVMGDIKKTREFLLEAKQYGLLLKSPSINKSNYYTISGKNELLIGLGNIKTLRRDFIKSIITERKIGGWYKSFNDFLSRIDHKYLKVDPIKALIYSGAFDSFSENRATLLGNLEKNISNVELSGENSELLSLLAPKSKKFDELSLDELLAGEKKYLGLFLSAHPVEQFDKVAKFYNTNLIAKTRANTNSRILCLIKEIKVIRTKTGEQMAFITVEDQSGEIDLTLFPRVFDRVTEDLELNKVYLVDGKSEIRHQKMQLIVSRMNLAEKLKIEMKEKLFLRLPSESSSSEKKNLLNILQSNAGNIPVVLYEEKTAIKWVLDKKYWVNKSSKVKKQLDNLIGKNNVVFRNESK